MRRGARQGVGTAVTLALASVLAGCATEPSAAPSIAIVAFAEHETASTCTDALLAALADHGYRAGPSLLVARYSAGGDASHSHAAWAAAVHSKPDLLIALGSPMIRVACAGTEARPTVAAYCFDLAAAGVVDGNGARLPFVTGVTSPPPVNAVVALLAAIRPQPLRIGVVYNPREAIAMNQVLTARVAFANAGMALVEAEIAAAVDIPSAMVQLRERGIAALWKLGDTTVAPAAATLLSLARDADLPVIGDHARQLDEGAIAFAAIDWSATGREAGKLAAAILAGARPADLPLVRETGAQVGWNRERAEALQLRVLRPDDHPR